MSSKRFAALAATAATFVVGAWGPSAVAGREGAKHLRAITATSPYAPGCDSDIERQGFGERVTDTETEPTLAVDPRDGRHLVA